eukprot:TRINITY_DN3929_c0_g1_i2.p1 TRINITY_DN3929_c0_g1~~TRINITY_DN3929_c0_g1_i2.p1  ORF type:complete len:265 (+),score=84.19 TRINITY_DN3929_c0_g1_i2:84-878(+)
MCIRDRYQRRVHGESLIKNKMKIAIISAFALLIVVSHASLADIERVYQESLEFFSNLGDLVLDLEEKNYDNILVHANSTVRSFKPLAKDLVNGFFPYLRHLHDIGYPTKEPFEAAAVAFMAIRKFIYQINTKSLDEALNDLQVVVNTTHQFKASLLPLIQKYKSIRQNPTNQKCQDAFELVDFGFELLGRQEDSISSRIRKVPVAVGGLVHALEYCGTNQSKKLFLNEVSNKKNGQSSDERVSRLQKIYQGLRRKLFRAPLILA